MLYWEFVDFLLIIFMFYYIDFVVLVLYYFKYVINLLILFLMSGDFRSGIEIIFGCCKKREWSESDIELIKFVIRCLEDILLFERGVNILEIIV